MIRTAQGAQPTADGGTRFRVWTPSASKVELVLDDRRVPLDACGRGYHETVLEGAGEGTRYRYALDGGEPLADPASRWQPDGVHGPSAVFDPDAFTWTDHGWRGVLLDDLVIYELHVGAFSDAGTFDGVAAHLDDLLSLGVTAIELMPVAQFPGTRNWGYDGVFPYAVQASYGGPHGLMRLVDECHRRGIAVVLDVVYNHIGPEGNVLDRYGPYFTDHYRTPWGPAMNVDQRCSDEVRRFMIDNALVWLLDFHIDALRLDAIHGIVDPSPNPFLAELAAEVHARSELEGRPLYLIAESDSNDVRVVLPRDEGGLGMDAQWCDDVHHAIHAYLTGERDGYYADFGSLEDVAKGIREGFVYDGRYSRYREKRHGSSSAGIDPRALVASIQNHDQVGNRMRGDRLSATLAMPDLRLAAGLLLLSPYTPLLFMGEEYGETAPFQYFVDHSESELLEAVRRGRAEEFEAFGWTEEPPDPADEKTFLRARLDRSLVEVPDHRALRFLYAELLRLRRTVPALRARHRDAISVELEWEVLSIRYHHDDGDVLALFNLSDIEQRPELPPGDWDVLIDGAAREGPPLPMLPRTFVAFAEQR